MSCLSTFAGPLIIFLVFCGTALAQFETRATKSITTSPFAIAVGDFNNDGKLDLAVPGFSPDNVLTVLLGNGDGTFRIGGTYPFGAQMAYIAAQSLRQNGILDLVITDRLSNNVWVLLGNGNGTFQAAVPYPTPSPSSAVDIGDFTEAGHLDIVAITESASCECISVLPGNGDGTFGAAITTLIPYNIGGFGLADGRFSKGGNLDIAVSGYFGSANQVDILLGNGNGTFSPDGYYGVSLSPLSVIAAELQGKRGTLDLAVGNFEGGSVSILLGNGDGTFQASVNYTAPFPTALAAADLNGDGRMDIAASSLSYPPGVTILYGNGDGTFQPGVVYPAPPDSSMNYVAVGDFNGDGMLDLALADYDGAALITMLNTGIVSFSPTTPLVFRKQAVGTTSSPQTVTLTNTGTTTLKISSMKASSQFGMTSTCSSNVDAGANCTISVTFSPTSEGTKSGTVTINNSASSKPMVIELSGTGTT
jgi:hypothetical protein